MATRRRRAERIRSLVEEALATPVLLAGDAEELVTALRASAVTSGIAVTARGTDADPARVAILALASDGKRSSLLKARLGFADLAPFLAPGAVRVAIIRSERVKLAPERLQRLLASEVLFHVSAALSDESATRSWGQRLSLMTLDAAGSQHPASGVADSDAVVARVLSAAQLARRSSASCDVDPGAAV